MKPLQGFVGREQICHTLHMHMSEHTLPVHADRLNYSRVTEWWSQGGDTPPGHHARASLLLAPSSAGFCWHMDTHSWWLHPALWLTSKLLQAFYKDFFFSFFSPLVISSFLATWSFQTSLGTGFCVAAPKHLGIHRGTAADISPVLLCQDGSAAPTSLEEGRARDAEAG